MFTTFIVFGCLYILPCLPLYLVGYRLCYGALCNTLKNSLLFLTGKQYKKYWLWTFLQCTLIFFAVHFWSDPTEWMSREHQGPSPQSNGWECVPFCRRYADLCTATECWAPELLPWPPSWSTCHRGQDIILDLPGHKRKYRFCYETVWQRQTAHKNRYAPLPTSSADCNQLIDAFRLGESTGVLHIPAGDLVQRTTDRRHRLIRQQGGPIARETGH